MSDNSVSERYADILEAAQEYGSVPFTAIMICRKIDPVNLDWHETSKALDYLAEEGILWKVGRSRDMLVQYSVKDPDAAPDEDPATELHRAHEAVMENDKVFRPEPGTHVFGNKAGRVTVDRFQDETWYRVDYWNRDWAYFNTVDRAVGSLLLEKGKIDASNELQRIHAQVSPFK